tara:strand:+ start:1966 stop:2736 length:771 start_codon:yes stop_codon:yes gene_type:complete
VSLFNSCIYSGFITHRRFKPKRHFFTYKTFSLLIDLKEIRSLEKKIKFFSYNKLNILSFYDTDHGPRDGSSLTEWVKKTLLNANIDIGSGNIKLLCYPRFFGYVFNPLSIFYCYNDALQLKAILYEVKNTFNEQHTYVFSASPKSNLIFHKCNKKFYVSPFMEMKTFYNFRLLNPGKIINIFIKQKDDEGTLLTACQVGKRIEMTSKNLFFQFLKHPLMSFKVIMAIHFEALRLWVKGVKFVQRKKKIKDDLSIEN